MIKLSVLIPTFNEQDFITDCLKSVYGWANEIIISDSGSTDDTLKIVRKFQTQRTKTPSPQSHYRHSKLALPRPWRVSESTPTTIKILKSPAGSFHTWRNHLLRYATGDWVFYLDADERATPELKAEIKRVLLENSQLTTCFAIPRRNFLLGQEMHHGGWYPDHVKRLFKRTALKKWTGELHEEPIFTGQLALLKSPLIHLQPDSLEPMLDKSIAWSSKEAQLLYNAGHPPATWWRILRMGATTLFQRLILKKAFLDNPRGVILALYQSWHTILVYLRLWELQLRDLKPQTSNLKSQNCNLKL
jgi:glycosyltransferase involved in cell wall biosynthesis